MLKEKLYSEYQKKYKKYTEKHKKVDILQLDIENLQAEGKQKKAEIEGQKKRELDSISDKKKELEEQLASAKKFKQFDETQLRQQLAEDKEREVTELASQYDESISQTQNSLRGIDDEYAESLSRELSYVEHDSALCNLYDDLSSKAVANELPQVITDVMAEPTEDVIQRNGINGGERAAQIAGAAAPLDDLSLYTPRWLTVLAGVGFPFIAGVGILLFFIFSGVHLGFVSVAANAIVTFLLWVLIAAIAGGIVFAITDAAWGIGKIGGIIGTILGFLIAANNWSVTLPYGVTNVVEWIVKVLICLLVGGGAYLLNICVGIEDAFVRMGMKIDFVKKAALIRQGYAIQENADSYCVLIKYREIIEQIVAENKQRRNAYLMGELERLEAEKVSALESLSEKIDQETERKVSEERELAEASVKKYEQLAGDIDSCDQEYIHTESDYDKKITDSIALYDKRVSDKNAKIKSLQKQFKPEFDAINDLFMKIYRGGSPELVETKGMVSDTLYIFNNEEVSELQEAIEGCNEETGRLSPVVLHEIRHEKNPIVFLYESGNSSTIATDLFRFMDAINIGLYTINCKSIYDLFITDPKSKGINFKEQQKAGRLKIVDDIKKLDGIIGESMDFVASRGQKISIDELNAELVDKGNDEEDIKRFGKYKIVQFIVPEEESIQTTDFFNNDIWTRFETSRKHGFLPIFYIKKSDWESALNDEEKFNSKFIMKLNKALGSKKNNIFEIDPKEISVKKYQIASRIHMSWLRFVF